MGEIISNDFSIGIEKSNYVEMVSNGFNIKVEKAKSFEIVSNNFNISINKDGEDAIVSNNFNININKSNINTIISNSFTIDVSKVETNTIVSNNFTIDINKTGTPEQIPVTSVSIEPKSHTMEIGDCIKLVATITPSNASNKKVSYESSDSEVVSVDKDGLATALKNGTVDITVTTEDGNKTDTCSITVKNAPPRISHVIATNETLSGSYTLTYVATDKEGSTLKHRIKFGSGEYSDINPTKSNGVYVYNGSGLSKGINQGKIEVSDGESKLESDIFMVVIPENLDSLKAKLKQSKTIYDVKHNDLKGVIKSIILDGKFDKENESVILNMAFENYNKSLSSYRELAQKSIDFIAKKKADDAEENSKKHTEAQITIVNDAIKSKVSQSVYDENNKLISQKMSELTQSVDGFEFKITTSKGYNKLLNSKFANKNHEGWNFANGAFRFYDLSDDYACEGRISIGQKGTSSGHFGTKIEGGMKPKTAYTVNIGVTKESNVIGTNIYIDYYKNGTYVNTQKVDFLKTNGERHNVTFISMDGDYNEGTFYIEHKGTTADEWDFLVKVDMPCLVEGTSCLGWSASPNELYDGITTINREGVKVSMHDGEGEQGHSLVSYQGMEIFDAKGNRKAWFGDNDNAFIDSLSSNKIESPNIVKKHMGSIALYVAATQTGNGSGQDASNRIGGIQNAINKIRFEYGEYIHGTVSIHVATGNYNENFWIEGFVGGGRFSVYFESGVVLNGRIGIDNMGKDVLIHGARSSNNANDGAQIVFNSTDDGQSCIWIKNSSVAIEGIRSYNKAIGGGNYRSKFAYMENGSRCFVWQCDISRYTIGLAGTVSCSGTIANSRGFCFNGCATMYGGHITMNNSPVEKSTSWAGEGGEVHAWGEKLPSLYDPGYGGSSPPPVPPSSYQWFENTFALSGLRTRPEGSGSGTSSRNGEWGQGKWGSYKPHRGYADLGNSPAEWCSGGRNFTVWLTMTRLNTSHGYAGATPKPKIKESNGNFWNSNVGFARGSTHTIQLPNNIAWDISQGNMKTLEMWAGTSTNDYSFYNNVSIKIKCEKQV